MIEAWASQNNFVRKDRDKPDDDDRGGRNAEVDFKGEARSNKTDESSTDPSARLYKNDELREANLRHLTHNRSENRNELVMDVKKSLATGTPEQVTLERMAKRSLRPGNTLGVDKGYNAREYAASSSSGKMVLTIVAGIAEFERALIAERISAGRLAAKKKVVVFGRPAKLSDDQVALGNRLLAEGTSVRDAAKLLNCHHVTLYQAINATGGQTGNPDLLRRQQLRGAPVY